MSSDIVISFVVSIVTGASASGVLVWLVKSWVSERLKNAIKAEYDEKLETHKAQLKGESDVAIERLKSELSIVVHEQHTMFAKLHEKRAETITELYSLLVEALWEAESFLSPMQLAGDIPKMEKYQNAHRKLVDMYRFFDKNRIYIPDSICKEMEGISNELRENISKLGTWIRVGEDNLSDNSKDRMQTMWDEAWKAIREDVPKARERIESEFRVVLGDKLTVNKSSHSAN